AGARAPSPGAHAGTGRHVSEGPVAVVVIQRVAAVARDVEILEAVVVVVADGDAHAVEVLRHAGDPGPLGDVDKRAVAGLVIETVPELRVCLVRPFALGHRIVDAGAVR